MNMTTDDDHWLEALAGKPNPAARTRTNSEATALRAALSAHKSASMAQAPVADDLLFQRIQNQLRTSRRQHAPQWLAVAATVVLGVGVVMNASLFMDDVTGDAGHLVTDAGVPDEALTVRGTALSIVQIVDDPEGESQKFKEELRAIGIPATISRNPAGNIQVAFPRTDKALTYLMEKRIIVSGSPERIVIVLEPTKHRAM